MKTNSYTYRIIALTMAFLIFGTSVGFSIDMHYCQGRLKSFSLFGKAKSCYQLADASSKKECTSHQKKITCKKMEGCSIDKKACCENKLMQFQLDQDQSLEYTELAGQQQLQQFIVAYIAVFHKHYIIKTELANFANYKPPLISRDIPVLFESFLL